MTSFLERLQDFLFSRKTFLVFAAVLLLYNFIGLIFLFREFNSDYWDHLMAMEAFSRNFLHPENLNVLFAERIHIYSPYQLFWGTIAHLLSVHSFFLLPFIGTLNLSLFLVALWITAKKIIGDSKYTLILLLTMLFFWVNPWHWSGYYNFGILPLGTVYPYFFTFPLSLIIICLFDEKVLHSLLKLALLVVLVSLIFASHPITGSFLIISLFVKVFILDNVTFKRKLLLPFLLILAVYLAGLFSPYPLFNMIFAVGKFHKSTFGGSYRLFYQQPFLKIFPSLFGLFYLGLMLKKGQLDFITLGFTAFFSIYLFNFFFIKNIVFARYILYVALFLQLSVVLLLRHYEKHKAAPLITAVFIVLLVIAIPKEFTRSKQKVGLFQDLAAGTSWGYHSNIRVFKMFRAYGKYVSSEDVVLTNQVNSEIISPVIGCKVVAYVHANPFVGDFEERLFDMEAFFSRDISLREKTKVLKKYQVDYVLIPRSKIIFFQNLKDRLEYLFSDEENFLFRVKT